MAKQLPLDLVFHDLLPRLPAKSIGRFRCVSKTWYYILKKPEFAMMHLDHIPKNDTQCHKLLVVCDPDNNPKLLTFDCDGKPHGTNPSAFPLEGIRDVFVLGSCNGLVCIALWYRRPSESEHSTALFIWNPLTKEYKILESITSSRTGLSHPHSWVFYYDECDKDYKIIDVSGEGKALMYSLKTNSWRVLDVDVINEAYYCGWEHGILFKRSIYWIAEDKRHQENYAILSFDLNNENLNVLPLPVGETGGFYFRLVIHQESLLALFVNGDNGIEFWSMNKDRKQIWEEMATKVSVADRWSYSLVGLFPICLISSCGKLIVMHATDERAENYGLFAYNLENDEIECIQIEKFRFPKDAIVYTQTFVSPNATPREFLKGIPF